MAGIHIFSFLRKVRLKLFGQEVRREDEERIRRAERDIGKERRGRRARGTRRVRYRDSRSSIWSLLRDPEEPYWTTAN